MNVASLTRRIDTELRAHGNRTRARNERAYLKSTLEHYGVAVPVIRRITKAAVRDAGGPTRQELVRTVDTLWARRVHELRMAAVELLVLRGELLREADIRWLERLIREADTWALVDVLGATVAGALVERHAALGRTLDRWAKDELFWVRRAALLAQLGPLRRGAGDFARFGRYADAMLEEREFFIRKAIGWILRDTSRKRPTVVRDWLAPRAARASGVTLREAVKYLPARDRQRLMRAHRARGATTAKATSKGQASMMKRERTTGRGGGAR